jgi:hypothetical protein
MIWLIQMTKHLEMADDLISVATPKPERTDVSALRRQRNPLQAIQTLHL